MTASARTAILGRVRAATGHAAQDFAEVAAAYEALPRPYIRAGKLDRTECMRLLIERLREYDAEVTECGPSELNTTIATQLAASGRRTFVVPPDLPKEWLAAGFGWNIGHGLSAEEVNRADGAVTAAFCAVADSGTIVLHHSATEGQRLMTLLPDWHLCVLRASQVVETLPEYFARCSTPPPLVTWISGPSATADIEMTRIKGVHGPRFLHVVLIRDELVQDETR